MEPIVVPQRTNGRDSSAYQAFLLTDQAACLTLH